MPSESVWAELPGATSTQPTPPGCCCIQARVAVVLPLPAEATTSRSGASAWLSSHSSYRERDRVGTPCSSRNVGLDGSTVAKRSKLIAIGPYPIGTEVPCNRTASLL